MKKSETAIKKLEMEAANQLTRTTKTIQDLNDKIAALEKSLEKSKEAMGGSSKAMNKQIDELKENMEELRISSLKSLKLAEEGWNAKMKEASDKFDASLLEEKVETQKLLGLAEDKLTKERESWDKKNKEEKIRTAEAVNNGEKLLGEATKSAKEKMKSAVEGWEKEKSKLQKRIAELGKNSAAETDLLKGESARMKKETADLKANLEKSVREVSEDEKTSDSNF